MPETPAWQGDVAWSLFKGATGSVLSAMYAVGNLVGSLPLKLLGIRQLALSALQDGNLVTAERYAREMLQAGELADAWYHGNAVHQGHLLLGEIALARDDRNLAIVELLAAARVSGSPQLISFGPNMRLARQLLNLGIPAPVLEYLELCRTFWTEGSAKLDAWAAAIRAGEPVDFGANVHY